MKNKIYCLQVCEKTTEALVKLSKCEYLSVTAFLYWESAKVIWAL